MNSWSSPLGGSVKTATRVAIPLCTRSAASSAPAPPEVSDTTMMSAGTTGSLTTSAHPAVRRTGSRTEGTATMAAAGSATAIRIAAHLGRRELMLGFMQSAHESALSGRLLLPTIGLVWGDWSQDARRSSISLFDVMATISSSRPNSHWLLRAANVKGGRRPSRNDLPLTVASTVADFVESGGTGVSRCISVIGRFSFFGSVSAKLRRSADAAPYGLGIRAHEKPPR